MKAQHTPGPWKLEGAEIIGSNGSMVVDPFDGSRAAKLLTIDEREANASLIAAAPDLLAFAERIAALPPHGHYVALIDEAIAAIAKATGARP